MAQATATDRPDYGDEAAARSAVLAAMGQADESQVEDDGSESDTDATADTTSDDDGDSGQSEDKSEETTDEGTESDDEETEEVEAKGASEEDDSPFSAADKAAIAADPHVAKMAKGLLKSYTTRMQALGEVAKFQKLIQGDPKTVLQRLAEAQGLKASFDDGKAALAADPAATITDRVNAVIEAKRAKWNPIIGTEATEAMLEGMRDIADAVAGSKVDPLVRGNDEREQASINAQVKSDFDRFAAEHPDWKDHEDAMVELGKKVNPQMTAYESLKFLHENVTRGQQIAKATTEVQKKLSDKVKHAAANAEPRPRTAIPGGKVKVAPHEYKTSDDAVRASLEEMGYSNF